MKSETIRISASGREMKCILLKPKNRNVRVPGILWIHGGGYITGMSEMVYVSAGKMLAETYGGVVLSPEYRLAEKGRYPAALEDCYAALEYMWDHADELGIDRDRIIVGGESAGGGLAAAVCLYARDQKRIRIRMQIPLYPMIDCRDTVSSKDNHGKVWNTAKNHYGWSVYLGDMYQTDRVPVYASPALNTDHTGLPQCYTFVSDGEPFCQETLDYVNALKQAGIRAEADVYHGDIHAFDLLCPWLQTSRDAKKKLCQVYESWVMKNG